jgi:hypothetical protein
MGLRMGHELHLAPRMIQSMEILQLPILALEENYCRNFRKTRFSNWPKIQKMLIQAMSGMIPYPIMILNQTLPKTPQIKHW